MFKKYLPALTAGFGASVFTTIPGLKDLACCLLVPAASFMALFLYKKVNAIDERIPASTGVMMGLATGLFAALFTTTLDVIITLITHSNDLMRTLPQTEVIISEWNLGPVMNESINLLKQMAKDINANGFSLLYTIMILLSNSITYSIFGLIGGLAAAAVFNKRLENK